MTRDFAVLGATSSAWDCRLIRRPTKILAEILNRAAAGLQEKASGRLKKQHLLTLRCRCIPMVQAAESRQGLNLAFGSRADCCRPTRWRVLRESRKIGFHGTLKPLAHPKAFSACLRTLYRHHWHVYSKRPFGGAERALRYLGHYTHRVAISNHRLVSLVDQQVTFRWRDRADNNQEKLLPLPLDEFLRRFLLHLLPKGFVRIRRFGFLANRRRATLLPLCFQVLNAVQPSQTEPEASPGWLCPNCGGKMVVIERLTAAQIQLRSPPSLAGVAA
jgi:hypothetical protein